MLNVTEKAIEALNDALDAEAAPPDNILLLRRVDQDIQLAVGREADGDQIVRYGGRNILAIDDQLSHQLDGASLDLAETSEGWQFILRQAS